MDQYNTLETRTVQRFFGGAGCWLLETWAEPLVLGRTLPTMPLWLADNLAVPLELEKSYEESCGILGVA